MNDLKSFVNESKTFNGFSFNGNYNMNVDVFIKLFDHFKRTGENYLDIYSELQYLLWESKERQLFVHDFVSCEKYLNYLSIARRLNLYNIDTIKWIRQYIKKCWIKYRDYLEKKRNEPRRMACRFTAMPEVKKYVYGKYGNRCLCCGSYEKISLDHVIPISKGGKDEIENLQPLCKSCNSKKGIKTIDYRV